MKDPGTARGAAAEALGLGKDSDAEDDRSLVGGGRPRTGVPCGVAAGNCRVENVQIDPNGGGRARGRERRVLGGGMNPRCLEADPVQRNIRAPLALVRDTIGDVGRMRPCGDHARWIPRRCQPVLGRGRTGQGRRLNGYVPARRDAENGRSSRCAAGRDKAEHEQQQRENVGATHEESMGTRANARQAARAEWCR